MPDSTQPNQTFKPYSFFRSWQALGWAVLIALIIGVWTDTFDISSIKAASFEVVLDKRAKELDVFSSPAFKNMKNLNEEQLKLFLIMGGDDAKFYRFTNTALNNHAAIDLYQSLQNDSLIRINQIGRDSTMVYPTDIGIKVHRALIQSLYSQLIK